MTKRIPDDDLNGVWFLAVSEPNKDWPADVVERLAADLIEARGHSVEEVERALATHSWRRGPEATPMAPLARHEVTTERDESVATVPELDPRDVEREVFE